MDKPLPLSTDYANLPRDQWPEIVTRKEAKEKGLKSFFTGKPCKWGHVSIRNKQGACRRCMLLRSRNATPEEKAARNKASREWAKRNPERYKALLARWRKNNPEKFKYLQKRWREENEDRIKEYYKENETRLREAAKAWRDNNRDRINKRKGEWLKTDKGKKWHAQYLLKTRDARLERRRARGQTLQGTKESVISSLGKEGIPREIVAQFPEEYFKAVHAARILNRQIKQNKTEQKQ